MEIEISLIVIEDQVRELNRDICMENLKISEVVCVNGGNKENRNEMSDDMKKVARRTDEMNGSMNCEYGSGRKEDRKTNLFDKQSAEPNLFELCRSEKSGVKTNEFGKTRVFELFRMVSFDDLKPTLAKVYGVKGDMHAYHEAFDELNLTVPAVDEDGEIYVRFGTCVMDDGGLCGDDDCEINVDGCDCAWEDVLGCKIDIEDGIRLSDGALAAHILWEMTFYRFSQDDVPDFFRAGGKNIYDVKRREVLSKMLSMYARGRKEKSECSRNRVGIDFMDTALERRVHRNRAKRMRDDRMDRAMKRLERMSKVENCITELIGICPELDREQLDFLFDTALVHETSFRQYKGKGEYVPATLVQLLKDCETAYNWDYDSLVAVIYSDSLENITPDTESSVADFLTAGRELQRCIMIKVECPSFVKKGEVFLKLVQSKDFTAKN